MAVDISRTDTCQAPVHVVFSYLADYTRIPEWMVGVESIELVGGPDRGVGAEYDATLNLGIRMHARIRAVEWQEDRAIGMDSVKGITVRSRWYFEPLGARVTRVAAHVVYEPPFGLAGRAAAKVVEPFIRRSVVESAKRLVENCERIARS